MVGAAPGCVAVPLVIGHHQGAATVARPRRQFLRRRDSCPATWPNAPFPTVCIPVNDDGAKVCSTVVGTNARSDATWIHSYVSADNTKTFCIYDGPSPEAVHETARNNNLPIDRITQVSVLDPYFYRG